MDFLSITKKSEIPESGMKPFNVCDKDILIIGQYGNYFAIDRICSHKGGDLSKGDLEKNIITCPRHGSKFDIRTGKSISGPRIGFIKLKTKDIKTYELKTKGDQILVKVKNT